MNVIQDVNYTPTDNCVKRLKNHTLNYISRLNINKSCTYPQCTRAGERRGGPLCTKVLKSLMSIHDGTVVLIDAGDGGV